MPLGGRTFRTKEKENFWRIDFKSKSNEVVSGKSYNESSFFTSTWSMNEQKLKTHLL